ncbi:MAG: tRNA (adenosine(37)-N6)-threonylcarbamoyltransferase complex ATPase subunit type 1 TsaE [Aaplasma endosymbiont of Hyalomma asiaticum]
MENFRRHEGLDLVSFCRVARNFVDNYLSRRRCSVALRGDLGVGKTAFSREVIEYLCGGGCFVGSPTYSIIHEYSGSGFVVYHVDLYRVSSLLEVRDLGFYDIFYDGVVIVEWPEVLVDSVVFDVDIEITRSATVVCGESLRDMSIRWHV